MRTKTNHTFISYTIRDGYITFDILSRIKTYFEKFGTTFIDLLDNDSLAKQDRILDEINIADSFILLNTPAINDSPWVAKEIEKAESRQLSIIELTINEIEKIKATNNVYKK